MDAFLAWMSIFSGEIAVAGTAFGQAITATSTTSLTVGTGSKSLTIGASKGFIPGMEVIVAVTASPTTRMTGTVTSYNATTGALVVSITAVQGSGTYAAWSIGPAATVSFDGQTFTDLRLAGKITEPPVAMPALALNPALGTNQTKTITGNVTFTDSVGNGESMVLTLTPGGYTMLWPAGIKWWWGVVPESPPSGAIRIQFDKQGSQLYGLYCGKVS
jgi:hypothetical protein